MPALPSPPLNSINSGSAPSSCCAPISPTAPDCVLHLSSLSGAWMVMLRLLWPLRIWFGPTKSNDQLEELSAMTKTGAVSGRPTAATGLTCGVNELARRFSVPARMSLWPRPRRDCEQSVRTRVSMIVSVRTPSHYTLSSAIPWLQQLDTPSLHAATHQHCKQHPAHANNCNSRSGLRVGGCQPKQRSHRSTICVCVVVVVVAVSNPHLSCFCV